MQKLLSVSVAVLLALPLAACDETPTQLSEQTQDVSETEVRANHASSDEAATATAVMRAAGTVAAEAHGFQRGEVVGTIHVTDDGQVTSVEGEASGLIPSRPYGSLFYDKLSSAQGSPTSGESALNASACEPGAFGDHPLFVSGPQMVISDDGTPAGLVGSWDVKSNGDATLEGETLAYVPLKKIGTVSIRDFSLVGEVEDGDLAPDEIVVACGVVTHDPAN